MNEKQFKIQNRQSSCTKRPWEYLIPKDIRNSVIAQVRQECLEIYGHDFTGCSKRRICFAKECLGRELEWKSKTAKPYLDKFAASTGIKENDLYFIKTNCNECPIFKDCKSICYQNNDYLIRNDMKSVDLVYQENLENHVIDNIKEDNQIIIKSLDMCIPWDILSEKKQLVVKKYLYEGKDFLTIAKELNLNNQAYCKYEFYSSLNKLSKYAIMRQLLKDDTFLSNNINTNSYNILSDIYEKGLNIIEVAKNRGVSKQTIQQTLTRVIKKYNVKWTTFVKKHKNKVIYNIPKLFK